MEAIPKDAHRPQKTFEGGSLTALSGLMAKDIVPNDPTERRRRNRLYALRAMDRLGLLGEENLIPTLARRPDLRWLADEEGARWGILTELGRIREPEAFEAAVGWVLENRAHTKEARAQIRRLRAGTIEPPGAPSG
jgi:hypothetical protein